MIIGITVHLVILTIYSEKNRLFRAMILVFKHFFYKNYVGLTLWPFIILMDIDLKGDHVLINHEKIHLRQQRELLILPFYIIYVIEWLLKSFYYFNFYKGYQNISFEREAYINEKDLDYLERRPLFGFINYYFINTR